MKSSPHCSLREHLRIARQRILLLLIVGFLFPNPTPAQSTSQEPPYRCAKFLSDIRPKPQHFQVCVDRSTLIHCAGGTEIFIPPHAFYFAESNDTVVDIADLQIQYKIDPQKPHAVGMKVSDPVDLRTVDKVDFAVTELLDAKSMLLSNLNCNMGDRLLMNPGAIRIKPSCEGRKLKLRKEIIILLPKRAENNDAAFHGNHSRFEFMRWKSMFAESPEQQLSQLFAEEPIPRELPLYLKEGLANPKKKVFANGSSVEYALEQGLQHYGYVPEEFNLQLEQEPILELPTWPEEDLERTDLQVNIVVGANGLAQNIRVLRDGKPVELTWLSIAAAQIKWDVHNWNLKDTIKLNASRMANQPEVFGSGISPEEQAYFEAPNLLQWGKMVHYLHKSVGAEKADQLMSQGLAVKRTGWLAFGNWNNSNPEVAKMSVDLGFSFEDAKVMVYLPKEGTMVEAPNPIQGNNPIHEVIPIGSSAKLIVLAQSKESGPLFSISNFVAADGLVLQPEMQPMPWPKIEAALRGL